MTDQPEKAGDYPFKVVIEGMAAEIDRLRALNAMLVDNRRRRGLPDYPKPPLGRAAVEEKP